MEKLLHPSIDVLKVEGTDAEALEFAMVILHDLGWFTQQCGIEHALDRIRSMHQIAPERFIQGCANGAAALHHALGREVSE